MSRRDKLAAVRRYLIANTGLPLITTEGNSNTLHAPYPYGFHVTTNRSNNAFAQLGHALPVDTLHSVIRYDAEINTVDEALVMLRLRAYAQLMHDHYEKHQRPIGE